MARILMVNDERDLLELSQSALCEVGHEVEIVTGGNLGVERARHGRLDLIIVDWVMPDLDGGTVLARLKGHPVTRDIPVLAISALPDGAVRAKLAGADHFLPKPFDIDELVNGVNCALGVSCATPIDTSPRSST
jgi:DNA-binding response OmpR family regulator